MQVDLARGGTNRPDVPPGAFAMPDGMRMRYDMSAPALHDSVSGYAAYINEHREPMVNWFLPAPPQISILLDAGVVSVSMRNRHFADIDQVSLYGPTTRAFKTVTHGGIAIGIGLTALGWARLIGRPAEELRDRVVPLAQVIDPAAVQQLLASLSALDSDALIAPTLDAWLGERLGGEHPDGGTLRRLIALTLTDGIASVGEVTGQLGITPHALRKIAGTHFGMTPKTLLSRGRFIRSVSRWMVEGEPAAYDGIDKSYFDAAHFLRDAHAYLGTTPRRFSQLPTTYLKASLRARTAVLGAPAQVLYDTPPPDTR